MVHRRQETEASPDPRGSRPVDLPTGVEEPKPRARLPLDHQPTVVDRVVVLSTRRGELVIVMLPSHSSRAEVMDVDEAEVRAAGDAAAVLIAERDAPPGGAGQRAQLESAVRGDSPHQATGALRAEELGDGLGDRTHVGRLGGFGDAFGGGFAKAFVDTREPDHLRVAGRALQGRGRDLDRVRPRLTPSPIAACAHGQRNLVSRLGLVPPAQRDLKDV